MVFNFIDFRIRLVKAEMSIENKALHLMFLWIINRDIIPQLQCYVIADWQISRKKYHPLPRSLLAIFSLYFNREI